MCGKVLCMCGRVHVFCVLMWRVHGVCRYVCGVCLCGKDIGVGTMR